MPKLSHFRKAMKRYIAMGKHLKNTIGARSKSTLLGLTRQDDASVHSMEMALLGSRHKARGMKIKAGNRPKCHRIRQ